MPEAVASSLSYRHCSSRNLMWYRVLVLEIPHCGNKLCLAFTCDSMRMVSVAKGTQAPRLWWKQTLILLMIYILQYLKDPKLWNYGTFLIMENAGLISSTVVTTLSKGRARSLPAADTVVPTSGIGNTCPKQR